MNVLRISKVKTRLAFRMMYVGNLTRHSQLRILSLFQSETNKTENSKYACILCFSCSVDANLSKFQISRKQGKILCHIPKKEEGTVGELVIRCPAPVPFHSLSEWDVGLNDSAT